MKRWIGWALLVMALCLCVGCGAAEQDSEATEPPADAGAARPRGYVLIAAGNEAKWFALPEEEPMNLTVNQTDADGNVYSNVICLTPEGVYMAASTCENQDCVQQGEVTLDNRELRVLGSWIICLPHQVSVELYSEADFEALLAAQEGEAGDDAD